MSGFSLGVASSLAATAATLAAGWLVSARVRRWLLAMVAGWAGLGALRVHRRQSGANADLPAELARARWLRIMVGRGNELTRDGFAPLWSGTGPSPDSVRILLPDPEQGEDSWLARREEEIRRADPGFHPGLLAQQVRTNSAYLAAATQRKNRIAFRFYDLPNLYRIIATDSVAYITLYQSAEHGRNSPCIIAQSPGKIYDFALRVFDTAWSRGRSPENGSET